MSTYVIPTGTSKEDSVGFTNEGEAGFVVLAAVGFEMCSVCGLFVVATLVVVAVRQAQEKANFHCMLFLVIN